MSKLKLVLAYNGSGFSGWQSQSDGNAIQDHLEKAFARITGEKVRVHGAGRTDAGVHALAQCAHADVAKVLSPGHWLGALNSNLPPMIRILRVHRTPGNFHARFSARGKIYRYRVWSGKVLSPFENGRVWHLISELDLRAMRSAATLLEGEHDFAGFAANRGQKEENTRRTLRSLTVSKRGPLVTLQFDGEGFLYKMARMITGALVDVGLGKSSLEEVKARLRGARVQRRVAAPACGLFLIRVRY